VIEKCDIYLEDKILILIFLERALKFETYAFPLVRAQLYASPVFGQRLHFYIHAPYFFYDANCIIRAPLTAVYYYRRKRQLKSYDNIN